MKHGEPNRLVLVLKIQRNHVSHVVLLVAIRILTYKGESAEFGLFEKFWYTGMKNLNGKEIQRGR